MSVSISKCIILLIKLSVITCAILRVGRPLKWETSKQFLHNVRLSGANQFAKHYNRIKDIQSPTFAWGDELEYGVFRRINSDINTTATTATDTTTSDLQVPSSYYDLSLRGTNIRLELSELEKKYPSYSDSSSEIGCEWQPEYGSWMVEAVPSQPYGGTLEDLLLVEKNMHLRRRRLHQSLDKDEIAPSISNFPMMGVKGYPHTIEPYGPAANSAYVSDSVINPHPRFGALTRNIRMRRERNVKIMIEKACPSKDDSHIVADAMAFGMGCCCLQVTMQSKDEEESRFLHDQLAVLSPYFLALSAATPIFNGYLANTDTRWDAISQAVDDRTIAESGEYDRSKIDSAKDALHADQDLAGSGVKSITKSRYSSVSRYIGKPRNDVEQKSLSALNNINAEIDDDVLSMLQDDYDIDNSLASHIAHLFIRDPLVIFDDSVFIDDDTTLDHFENIQSTNWRSIRWKTPSLQLGLLQPNGEDSSNKLSIGDQKKYPGWRVEFRPLEIQLTDFENAAYAIMIVLTTKCLLKMGYNFYLPMSYVEENMKRAQKKDALLYEKFFISKNAFNIDQKHIPSDVASIEIIEVTIDQLFNGYEGGFVGLIPSVLKYIEEISSSSSGSSSSSSSSSKATVQEIIPYLQLLSNRASGKIPTNASWIRSFIGKHPDYKHDGVVPTTAATDLLTLCDGIGMIDRNKSNLLHLL